MPKLRQPTAADFVLLITMLFLTVEFTQIVVSYLSLAGEAIRFPFPLNYAEGPMLDQTLRLARGENIYPNTFAAPPYLVTTDPPLFHLAQLPFASGGASYAYGRAISLVSALTSGLFLALICQRLTGDWLAAAVAGLLLFAFPHITYGSLFGQADALALSLSLAGLYLVVRWPHRVVMIALAAALFVAAIYTRSSCVIAGPATAFVWLMWGQRLRRQALVLISIVLGASFALFVGLNAATSGGFFLNTLVASVNPFDWFRVMGAFINLFVHSAFLVIAGIIFLTLERTTERTRSWPFVLTYAAFAALGAFAAGAASATLSYFNELVAALCLLMGATIAWAGANTWFKVAALAVVAVQLTDLREWSQESYLGVVASRIVQQPEAAELAKLIQRTTDDVLLDEYIGYLPLQARRIYIQPAEFNRLNALGLWSERPLIDQINRRAFPLIALYEPIGGEPLIVQRWPKPVRDAIYDNYQLQGRLAEALIYVPK